MITRLDVNGYRELDDEAKAKLDQWAVDNSIHLLHVYSLTYDDLAHMVTIYSYAIDESGRFILDQKQRSAITAPPREIRCENCPWI